MLRRTGDIVAAASPYALFFTPLMYLGPPPFSRGGVGGRGPRAGQT